MSDLVLPDGTARPSYPDPLPDWVSTLRPHQVDAVREIIAAFEDHDVVFLDAPVGAGKTLIGELVRRELRVAQSLYLCSDKALQRQFLRDFPYARVLMGRANYRPLKATGLITCDDCTQMGPQTPCLYCDPTHACPYKQAKQAALDAQLAVLNTSMFLTLANYTHDFATNDLVIVDECDLLEQSLIGFVEYEIPQWLAKECGVEMPKKGVHKPTLVRWLQEFADAIDFFLDDRGDKLEPKRLRAAKSFRSETLNVAEMLQKDVERARSVDDQAGYWLRDYETRTLKLRPVTVQQYGVRKLWRWGKKWLLMSGTIISADEIADSLGLPLDYYSISLPSTFPVENRPVILAPIADVVRAKGIDEWDKLVYAIERICAEHDGRVLVHTVSYQLAKYLRDNTDLGRRRKVTYTEARNKQAALNEYLAHDNAVMFAPSMDRGIDLAGDKCRVQIICKVPFLSFGDRQVAARVRLDGGEFWYSVQAIRTLVQMTGRGVRSADDSCTTYILDRQFVANLMRRYEHIFPPYFRDALVLNHNPRWLIRGRAAA